MGVAIDTVGLAFTSAATASNAWQRLNPISGDSLTVRNFSPNDRAYLVNILRQGAETNLIRVRSPLLHDNVTGIVSVIGENPGQFSLPPQVLQPLYPQDTLTVELYDNTANAANVAALQVYYTNLLGSAARLHMPGDIMGIVKSIKSIQVQVTATSQTWSEALITATEDLTHANTDYAVLGMTCNLPVAAITIRGIDTGNLRVSVPGTVRTDHAADYFISLSNWTQLPCIPVFNSANKGSTYVGVLANSSLTVMVSVICAELSQRVS
jgi:hypothetical protein